MALKRLSPLTIGVDAVGFVWEKLRGYLGALAVAKEVLQNADDAFRDDRGPTHLEFDFTSESLIVRHNGKPFDQRDFESITLIASGSKRADADRGGTFGVGFVSVYHVTDRPAVESNGWRISWNVQDHEALPEQVPWSEWTRFEFRWRSEPTDFSRRIGAETWNEARRTAFLHDLGRNLADLVVFLRYITEIDVLRDGRRIYSVKKTRQRPRGTRGSFDLDVAWEGPKERRGERWLCVCAGVKNEELVGLLKPRVGEESDLCLGFRLSPHLRSEFEGLIYNLLPTAVSSSFPFHIEGQFFPNSERTSIIVGEGEASGWTDEAKWNTKLIEAAGPLLVEAMEQLKESLRGRESDLYAYLPVKEPRFSFVGQIRVECLKASRARNWIWTAAHDWRRARDTYRIEPNLRRALEGEAVEFVEAKVQQRYDRLLDVMGVPSFGPGELYALLSGRVSEAMPLSEAPSCIDAPSKLNTIYRFLATHTDEIEAVWADLPVWVSQDARLETADRLWLPDEEFRQLFGEQGATFLHDAVEVPISLVGRLGIQRLGRQYIAAVVDFLESLRLTRLPMAEAAPPLDDFRSLQRLYRYLARGVAEISPADLVGVSTRLRHLPIYPNQAGTLQAIDDAESPLSLPPKEPLEAPLNVESIIHPEVLKGNRSFFEDVLRIETLALDRYVRDYLVREYGRADLGADDKFTVLEWVRKIHPQLHEAAWNILRGSRLVECADGLFRCGTEVYFRNQTLDELIGAYAIPSRRYRGEPWKDFLSKLGVTTEPREQDLVQAVQAIASAPVSDQAIRQARALFQYVDGIFRMTAAKPPTVLQSLAEVAWLPARGDSRRWYRGKDLYPLDAEPLVGPEKSFLRFQRPGGQFAKFLGLREPTVEDMVQCLISSSNAKRPVNRQIYERLNAALLKDRARVQPQLARLVGQSVIYHNRRYWEAHQTFFADYRREFGKYRVYLGRSRAVDFFEAIGVTDELEPARYVGFLLDIGEWRRAEVLSEQDCLLVENAYLRLADADAADLEPLLGEDVILDHTGRLIAPDSVFLLDRPALVRKFGEASIPRPMTTHVAALRVLERIGVERFSAVVKVVPIDLQGDQEIPSLTSRIRLLTPALRRIRDTLAKRFVDGWRPGEVWSTLRVRLAPRIRLLYRYPLTGGWVDSEVHEEQVYLDESAAVLYVAQQETVALANALAQWLNPELDSAQLSPVLTLLLDRRPGNEKELLDSLGFDDLGVEGPLPEPIRAPATVPEQGGQDHAGTADEQEDDADRELLTENAAGRGPRSAEGSSPTAPGQRGSATSGSRPDSATAGKDTGARPAAVLPAREFRVAIVYPTPGRTREDGRGSSGDLVEKGTEGVWWAMRYEVQEGRQPRDVSAENRGYDIESVGPTGRRLIEVKLRSSLGTGVLDLILTPNEATAALRHRETYYVYVVEKFQHVNDQVIVHEARLDSASIRWGGVASKSQRLSAEPSAGPQHDLAQTQELFLGAVRQLGDGIFDVAVLSETASLFTELAVALDLNDIQRLVGSLDSQIRNTPQVKHAIAEALKKDLCAAWEMRNADRTDRLLDVLELWDQESARHCLVNRDDVSNYRAFMACSDAWERYRLADRLPFLTAEERAAVRRAVWETERSRLDQSLTPENLMTAVELFSRLAAVMADAAELRHPALRLAELLEQSGETALQAGQGAKATVDFEAGIALYQQLRGKTERQRRREAVLFEGLAEAYAQTDRPHDAVLAYEFLRTAAQDHEEVRDIVGPLARLYSSIGLPDRAADVLDEFPGDYSEIRAVCVEDRRATKSAHKAWKDFLVKGQASERYVRLGLVAVIEALLSDEQFWESAAGGSS